MNFRERGGYTEFFAVLHYLLPLLLHNIPPDLLLYIAFGNHEYQVLFVVSLGYHALLTLLGNSFHDGCHRINE